MSPPCAGSFSPSAQSSQQFAASHQYPARIWFQVLLTPGFWLLSPKLTTDLLIADY